MGGLLIGVLIVTASAPSAAQPRVRVRAETRIELGIAREPGGVVVEGALRDDRGEALPGRTVTLTVRAPGVPSDARDGRTDDAGAFAAHFPLEVGTYRVSAHYDGEDGYRGQTVAQELDLSRAHVRFGIRREDGVPLDRIDLDVAEHTIVVVAESPAGAGGLLVELTNEVEEVLAAGTADESGTVSLLLPSDRLGPPAAGRIVVRTPGDALRAAAQLEMPVVRFRNTQLELEVEPRVLAPGDRLRVRGRLEDRSGPIARRAVGIFDAERHLTTVLTDDEGRFERELDPERDRTTLQVGARFASDAPWRPAARSGVTAVRIEAGSSAGTWWWLLAPMLVSALLIGLLSRRGSTTAPRPPEARESLPAPPGIEGGESQRGPASRRDVGGLVLDTDEGRPLGDAAVTLRSGDREIEGRTDEAGRFAFDDVPDGRWQLTAEAPGFEARSAPIEVPHRGSWSALRVRLQSLRRVALSRYRPLAEALTPERRWWAFWTARELVERAPRELRDDVAELTEEVERAAYGGPPPDDAAVDAIGERSGALAGRVREPDEGVSGRR